MRYMPNASYHALAVFVAFGAAPAIADESTILHEISDLFAVPLRFTPL